MNLKTIGIGVTAALTMTTGAVLSSAPAQAAIIGSGGFLLNGPTSVSGAGTANPAINFSSFNIASGSAYGAFAGLSGTPTIKSLSLTDFGSINTPPNPPGVFANPSVTDFITGLTLGGVNVAFDLDASGINLFGSIVDATNFNIAGPITGTFRAGNTVIGKGFLGANNIGSVGGPISSISLTATAIPTPALLPGLVAMGVGVLRKRKAEAAKEAVEV